MLQTINPDRAASSSGCGPENVSWRPRSGMVLSATWLEAVPVRSKSHEPFLALSVRQVAPGASVVWPSAGCRPYSLSVGTGR